MFHPLLPDLTTLKDVDIDAKLVDLNKKYSIAAKMGDGSLSHQVALAIQGYRDEQQRRAFEKIKVLVNKQDKDLGSLINVD